MRYKVIIYILLGTTLIFNQHILAQDFIAGEMITLDVDEYSLIETNHAPVSLTFNSAVVGAPIAAVSNSDMFLKLSSIVPLGTRRQATARIQSGIIPAGTTLSLVAARCTTTNSGGKLGNPKAAIILGSADQSIIGGIGTCYTGTGYNDGHQLTYTWAPTAIAADYSLINATTSTTNIIVSFTLTSAE